MPHAESHRSLAGTGKVGRPGNGAAPRHGDPFRRIRLETAALIRRR
jgi:hypothetical protein